MEPLKRALIASAVTVSAISVTPDYLSAQLNQCQRPAPRVASVGAVVALKEPVRSPCAIEFVRTGIELRADASGIVEDIGASVVRTSAGEFFTSTKTGEITSWTSAGKYQRNFGRIGTGPGEFAAGPKRLLLDSQGRLFVGDNNVRWSIFGIDNQFQFSFPASLMGIGASGCCVILDNNTFLSGWGGPGVAFRIYDFTQREAATPPVVRAFGEREKYGRNRRRIAYAGGNSFWTAPDNESGEGYVLEQWSTDGVRLRTLIRDVPWLPKGSLAAGPIAPEMLLFHLNSNGLLYVSFSIKKSSFASLSPAEQRDRSPQSQADRSMDRYFDVIDLRASAILVTIGPMRESEATKRFPSAFFQSSDLAYQFDESADGLPIVRILQAKLVRK